MAGKPPKRRRGEPQSPQTVKLSIRVSADLARRLGVEAAMLRRSQSSIVEDVLGGHLKRWRLPSTIEEAVTPSKPTSTAPQAADEAA